MGEKQARPRCLGRSGDCACCVVLCFLLGTRELLPTGICHPFPRSEEPRWVRPHRSLRQKRQKALAGRVLREHRTMLLRHGEALSVLSFVCALTCHMRSIKRTQQVRPRSSLLLPSVPCALRSPVTHLVPVHPSLTPTRHSRRSGIFGCWHCCDSLTVRDDRSINPHSILGESLATTSDMLGNLCTSSGIGTLFVPSPLFAPLMQSLWRTRFLFDWFQRG